MEIAKLWTRSFDTKFLAAWSVGRPSGGLVMNVIRTILSARESQPKLQQFVPRVAFDDAFDDAIDVRRTLQRRQERRAGELLCGATHEGLSRITPHARFAQYIGKRPARRDAALHAADGPDFLGEDPQHSRRRLAFAAQAFEHARKPRALAREHRFGELERVVARHVHH